MGAYEGDGENSCVPQCESEPRPVTFESTCHDERTTMKYIGIRIKMLMDHKVFSGEEKYSGQHGEMKANIMLTYRHIEDARMRIGKILQAADDGVSILDK